MAKEKIGLFIAVLIGVLAFFNLFAYASDNVEITDLNVIINGKTVSFSGVPIILNGRTMLPFREVLTNLGVPDDEEHIIWNGVQKSVTVIYGSQKICLKANDKSAHVGDLEVVMDVAPIINSKNNRVYIPVRFIAQALGNKVVWDESTKSVLIKNEQGYEQVKATLEKINNSISEIQKYKYVMDHDVTFKNTDSGENSLWKIQAQVDRENKAIHQLLSWNDLAAQYHMEMFFKDNEIFKQSMMGWIKDEVSGTDYLSQYNQNTFLDDLAVSDLLCAGLVQKQGNTPEVIVLSGDVYIDELIHKALHRAPFKFDEGVYQYDLKLEKFNVEIILDKSSSLLRSINMYIEGNLDYLYNEVEDEEFEMKVKLLFSEYDTDFKITVPSVN
ncbi:stalk domain-containing protein [Acetivibrio cellulolyticus]|uniref:stalk domain-containing protein n=1 Tax=Acetivibrio cellulolyticus TaxID=35830 RepID=UPI0001E301B6|nr:copper amine oxidase N-terminal domain-containing protein [Acetivibrio cellulolyticus]